MELFLIYLWLKLDIVVYILSVIAVVFTSACAFGLLVRLIEGYDSIYKDTPSAVAFRKKHKVAFIVFLISGILYVLVPNRTDVAILVGSSIAIDMAKSPEGAKVATLLRGKANELLDAEIAKITPVKK